MGQYAGSDIVLESNSLLRAVFLYQENHAIVAWFRESFSGVFRNKNS
jgi:hypothetical protein